MIIIMSIILFPASAIAGDWSVEDTQRELLYSAIVAIDIEQTKSAITSQEFIEKNVLLGEQPTNDRLTKYGVSVVVGHALVSYLLPAESRYWFQKLTIFLHATVLPKNHMIGARIEF